MTIQDIDQTVAFVLGRRPTLGPFLQAFAPLFKTREELLEPLTALLAEQGIALPDFAREQALQGAPLLTGMQSTGLAPAIRLAASRILPLFLDNFDTAEWRGPLEEFFRQSQDKTLETLLNAILAENEIALEELAGKSGLAPEWLKTTGEFVCSPVLFALASQQTGPDQPWDEEGVWNEGFCPVCGSYPSIGWLDRPVIEEKNAFLAGGGGKKHLYCPLCGASWKFRRSVCPGCSSENTIQVLKEDGTHGERLDFCASCRRYCNIVDLRELPAMPQMDAMSIGMLHLDMAARDRELKPLRPSVWNTF